MKITPLDEAARRWSTRPFGYVFTFVVEGGPYRDESRDRKWILGSLKRFPANNVREAIMQVRGLGSKDRWQMLADTFGVR